MAASTRSTVLPDVPTVAETVPGYEAIAWLVIAAPKDTPASVLETLNKSINAGLADPKVNQTIVEWGESPFVVSREELRRFLVSENEKWGRIIREANIKL